jgi:hypothetical protein
MAPGDPECGFSNISPYSVPERTEEMLTSLLRLLSSRKTAKLDLTVFQVKSMNRSRDLDDRYLYKDRSGGYFAISREPGPCLRLCFRRRLSSLLDAGWLAGFQRPPVPLFMQQHQMWGALHQCGPSIQGWCAAR